MDRVGSMKRVVCLGGGPAGLYSAILLRKALPGARVEVYERNRPDDTFGWGVVFSDQTMDNFRVADPETHAAIVGSFHHWDDIEIHFRGEVLRSGGHGFCGISRKQLLGILQERASELGVELNFQREIDDDGAFADADLVIGSRRRQQPRAHAARCGLRPVGRRAPMSIHLARHCPPVRRLHLCLRADRARLVPDPRVPVQRGSVDRHRRDPRGDLAGARPGPVRHRTSRSSSASACSHDTSVASGCRATRATCAAPPGSTSTAWHAGAGITAEWC